MIAVDSNLLVYAHRGDSEWHVRATAGLREPADGRAAWAIPWPYVHEFLAIVTHSRIYKPPTPLSAALTLVDAWLESPSLVLLGESGDYRRTLRRLLESPGTPGPRVHDARVVALCRLHGVRESWSADREFGRFSGVTVRKPLSG